MSKRSVMSPLTATFAPASSQRIDTHCLNLLPKPYCCSKTFVQKLPRHPVVCFAKIQCHKNRRGLRAINVSFGFPHQHQVVQDASTSYEPPVLWEHPRIHEQGNSAHEHLCNYLVKRGQQRNGTPILYCAFLGSKAIKLSLNLAPKVPICQAS